MARFLLISKGMEGKMIKRNSIFVVLGTVALLAMALTGCKSVEAGHSSDISSTLSKNAVLKRGWKELPIEMHISESVPERLRPAIRSAMEMWNAEAGFTVFHYAGVTDDMEADFDEVNAIYWDTEPHPDGHFGKAETMFIYDDLIVEGDVTFYGDPDDFDALSCYDAEESCRVAVYKKDIVTTALHELGHILGFGHTDEIGYIMNPDFSRGDVHQKFDDVLLSELRDVYEPIMLACAE